MVDCDPSFGLSPSMKSARPSIDSYNNAQSQVSTNILRHPHTTPSTHRPPCPRSQSPSLITQTLLQHGLVLVVSAHKSALISAPVPATIRKQSEHTFSAEIFSSISCKFTCCKGTMSSAIRSYSGHQHLLIKPRFEVRDEQFLLKPQRSPLALTALRYPCRHIRVCSVISRHMIQEGSWLRLHVASGCQVHVKFRRSIMVAARRLMSVRSHNQ